jgi:aryl-alcohol dehydrogenase-like predicted oxidoreductase
MYFRGDRKKEVEDHVNALMADMEIDADALPSVALRYILSNPAVATAIPGMRSVSSVNKNVTAPMLGPLPAAELEIVKRHAWTKNFYS